MQKFTNVMTFACRPRRLQAFYRRHPKGFVTAYVGQYVVLGMVCAAVAVNEKLAERKDAVLYAQLCEGL